MILGAKQNTWWMEVTVRVSVEHCVTRFKEIRLAIKLREVESIFSFLVGEVRKVKSADAVRPISSFIERRVACERKMEIQEETLGGVKNFARLCNLCLHISLRSRIFYYFKQINGEILFTLTSTSCFKNICPRRLPCPWISRFLCGRRLFISQNCVMFT